MKQIIYILLIITISLKLYSQENCNQLDSLGFRHGVWQLEREYYYKIRKNQPVIESGIEKGLYTHGKRENFWMVFDKKGNLLRQELYKNDSLILIIKYKKNRIYSISVIRDSIVDLTNYNNRGKVKIHSYKDINGKTITNKY